MTKLNQKALASVLGVLVAMAILMFFPAATIHYWQAWVFLAVYGVCALAITLYLMKRDPALLGRRLRGGPIAEKKPAQKIIQSITALGFVAMLVLPATDHRFHGTADEERRRHQDLVVGAAALARAVLLDPQTY